MMLKIISLRIWKRKNSITLSILQNKSFKKYLGVSRKGPCGPNLQKCSSRRLKGVFSRLAHDVVVAYWRHHNVAGNGGTKKVACLRTHEKLCNISQLISNPHEIFDPQQQFYVNHFTVWQDHPVVSIKLLVRGIFAMLCQAGLPKHREAYIVSSTAPKECGMLDIMSVWRNH